jgi:dipeptidyl aminopeptidase/acylaminoacyl peptidase
VLLAPLCVSAQARPLAIEDYYRVRSVGSPSISPDGRWVSYTVSLPLEETNNSRTEAYVVRADGSAPATLVRHAEQNVSNVRWGDDNRLRYNVQNETFAFDPERTPSTGTRSARTASAFRSPTVATARPPRSSSSPRPEARSRGSSPASACR